MKLYLAPMHGVTDYIYRNALATVYTGIDSSITPFIRTGNGKKVKRTRLNDVRPETNQKMSIIPQILSNNTDQFTVLAKELFDLGYDEINLNMGCPYPMVTKKGSGAGMLQDLKKTEQFLQTVMANIPTKLSVKVRTGFESHDELPDIVSLLNQFEFENVTVHPRTAVQMYKGTVDNRSFEYCMAHLKHPLIYNGDILSLVDFSKFQSQFPDIKDWMIGRGILMDPTLPMKIKGNSLSAEQDRLLFKQFHSLLLEGYSEVIFSEHHVLDRMKSLWEYWTTGSGDIKLFRNIKRCKKMDEYLRVINL